MKEAFTWTGCWEIFEYHSWTMKVPSSLYFLLILWTYSVIESTKLTPIPTLHYFNWFIDLIWTSYYSSMIKRKFSEFFQYTSRLLFLKFFLNCVKIQHPISKKRKYLWEISFFSEHFHQKYYREFVFTKAPVNLNFYHEHISVNLKKSF